MRRAAGDAYGRKSIRLAATATRAGASRHVCDARTLMTSGNTLVTLATCRIGYRRIEISS